MHGARACALILLVIHARAMAGDAGDADDAALALADRSDAQASAPRACVEQAEAAAGESTWSDGRAPTDGGRASVDLRCDGAFAGAWRAALSDRVDYLWSRGGAAQTVNTLKEAYVTWRAAPNQLFDLGRINVREGVGLAYNPTDYFRADALRTILSPDPQTLRTERLGSIMARSQTLWASGSLTAIYSPRLATRPNSASFSADLGASNSRSRWVLALSQRLFGHFQPQWLLTQAEHGPVEAGLDLTWLLSSATVGYVEWSGGRSGGNLALSGVAPARGDAFQSRLSTGLTYTTPFKLSASLEYEYDGAAADDREWGMLRRVPVLFVRYRVLAADQQELATRQNLFALATWQDVGVARLDLTLLARYDIYDHSRLTWGEVRYHWQRSAVAIQWQRNDGSAASDFSLWPARQSWLALFDYYF